MNCEEFVTVTVHLKRIDSEEHLPKAFNYFDKNQSGYIEIDELREAIGGLELSEQVILDIIADVDKDKVVSTSSSWDPSFTLPIRLLAFSSN